MLKEVIEATNIQKKSKIPGLNWMQMESFLLRWYKIIHSSKLIVGMREPNVCIFQHLLHHTSLRTASGMV